MLLVVSITLFVAVACRPLEFESLQRMNKCTVQLNLSILEQFWINYSDGNILILCSGICRKVLVEFKIIFTWFQN